MKKGNGLSSFYWKVYIVTVAFVLLTVVLVTLIFRTIQKNAYYSQLEREFRTEAFLLSQLFSIAQKPYIIEEWRLEGKPRITVITRNGEVQLDTHFNPFKMKNELSKPEVADAVQHGWGKSVRWSEYVGLKMFFVAGYFDYGNRPATIIRIALPLYEINRTINRTTSTVLLGGLIIFVVVSIFSFVMMREITNPIMRIAASIREFSNGNFSIRLPFFRNKEFNLLSAELNRMIESITKGKGELSMVKDQTGKILTSMHEGIILVDRNGLIKRANRATRDIFGLHAGRLTGKNLFSIIESEEMKEGVKSIIDGRERVSGVVSIHVPDERRIEFTCTPFGDRTGVVIALHDITKIAKLEQIRREFVGNVSHELKTPITSLKGFVDTLIEMNPLNGETAKRFLTIIQKNILRMEHIIEDLLTLSRIESGSYKLPESIISVNDCIMDAIGVVKMKYPGRNITARGCEYPFRIRGDQNLIELALVNLIDNAVKYSDGEVEVILDGNYRRVYVSIKDQGLGIPSADTQKIFESFYRVDKTRSRALGGTGLGLTIVKNIAETHKGKIMVYSELGKGSIFRLELPRHTDY